MVSVWAVYVVRTHARAHDVSIDHCPDSQGRVLAMLLLLGSDLT